VGLCAEGFRGAMLQGAKLPFDANVDAVFDETRLDSTATII
jgi:hypothetical protein